MKTMKTIAQILNHDFSKGYLYLYDKDGKEVYYENSNGYWIKSEYKNGNDVYCETSTGFWWKSEYKDGEQVYYENSNGIIEDKRNTCNGKIVEIDGKKYQLKEI